MLAARKFYFDNLESRLDAEPEAGIERHREIREKLSEDAFSIYTDPEILRSEAIRTLVDLPQEYNRYLAIGAGYVPIICFDEKEQGAVYAIDIAGHHANCFMNSSVPQLAQTLLVWRACVRWAEQKEPDDAEALEYARHLEQTIRQIDFPAMQESSNYWSQALRDALI